MDEDVGAGDVTSEATVPAEARALGRLIARDACVVSGLVLLEPLAALLERRSGSEAGVSMHESVGDGASVAAATTLCVVEGRARTLLTLERTFLNFVGSMSGVATTTDRYVAAVRETGSKARVLDTRKTTPGHRLLEKYAVRCGGGSNHRMGLFDAVLIKDNHVVAAGGVEAAVAAAMAQAPDGVQVEVECDSLAQVERALAAGATSVLLDNFSPSAVAEAVAAIDGRARVEVSGGIDLQTIGDYARAGADDISVGRLTHSAPCVDVSLEFEPTS